MFAVKLKEVFSRIEVDKVECDGCPCLRFSNEDSGIEEHCIGTYWDCPRVDSKKEELEEFMADHPEEFELIKEVR